MQDMISEEVRSFFMGRVRTGMLATVCAEDRLMLRQFGMSQMAMPDG